MSDRTIDIQALQRAAETALLKAHGVCGGWSARIDCGSVYKGATFPFPPGKWVVVTGHQRPAAAQLLDATACLMRQRGAQRGIALLRPPKGGGYEQAPDEFLTRYQAAAWDGLGIVAIQEPSRSTSWTWTPGKSPEPGDIETLASDVVRAIEEDRRVNGAEWDDVVARRASRRAEKLVRAAVTEALGARFEEKRGNSLKFKAVWRTAIADGVWATAGSDPYRIALEVKVGEDVCAPFSQALDDLGRFDAVVYVRLVDELTRAQGRRLAGLEEARRHVQQRLPVRYIDVPFPGSDRSP